MMDSLLEYCYICNMYKLFKYGGFGSIVLGLMASLTCIVPSTMFYGLIASFMGFILSIISIFVNTRFEYSKKKWIPAYFGMLLSSVPVLYLLIIIFLTKE